MWVLVSNVFSWFGFCGTWGTQDLSSCVTHVGEHVLLYLTSKVPELRTLVVYLGSSRPIFLEGTRLDSVHTSTWKAECLGALLSLGLPSDLKSGEDTKMMRQSHHEKE